MNTKQLCNYILGELGDENKTVDDKTIFFMDNFDTIMDIMKEIKENKDNVSDEDKLFYDTFIDAINNIRNIMMVDKDTQKEDIIVSKETIQESLESNKKVQDLQKDLQDTINAEYTPVDNYFIEFYSGETSVGNYTYNNATIDNLENYINSVIQKNTNISITNVKAYRLTPINVTVSTVTKVTIN